MRTFRQAMTSAKNTMTAAGDGQPWKSLYRGLHYVERAASWLKIKCWHRSIRSIRRNA